MQEFCGRQIRSVGEKYSLWGEKISSVGSLEYLRHTLLEPPQRELPQELPSPLVSHAPARLRMKAQMLYLVRQRLAVMLLRQVPRLALVNNPRYTSLRRGDTRQTMLHRLQQHQRKTLIGVVRGEHEHIRPKEVSLLVPAVLLSVVAD